MVKRPLVEAKFRTIRDLHVHMQNALEYIIAQAFTMYEEPESTSLDGFLSCNPVKLGLPLDEMCATENPFGNVCSLIQPYCVTNRMDKINYSMGYMAEGIDLYPIRESAFILAKEEMRPLRDVIIVHEEYMLGGAPDAAPYKVLHANDIINIVANPFNLNAMFEHLPLPVHYSSELVLEALMPEISVTPLSPSQLVMNAGFSTSKITVINSFTRINERPKMDVALGYYVASFICPGCIVFNINLDDITGDDMYLRGFAACVAKLMFSYNHEARWNSLSGSSVRAVEAAIVRCGIAGGILETPPNVIGGLFPLHNANPIILTTPEGGGWRESGGMRYGQAPVTSPYIDCQNRQVFVTPLDELTDMDDETINYYLAAWNTRHALYRFIACLSTGRV